MEGSNKNTFANWKETARRFLREKGLYVAALAGLAAAGGGLWLANAPAKEQTPAPTPTPAQVSLSQDQRLEEAKAELYREQARKLRLENDAAEAKREL